MPEACTRAEGATGLLYPLLLEAGEDGGCQEPKPPDGSQSSKPLAWECGERSVLALMEAAGP